MRELASREHHLQPFTLRRLTQKPSNAKHQAAPLGARLHAFVGCHAWAHLITSSARTRIDSGMFSPSAFAVLRLTISLNLVGCSIGKSAGLAPLSILST